jgi:hypothetical protein
MIHLVFVLIMFFVGMGGILHRRCPRMDFVS